ncbi:MAG: proline--tRNA ligase, partial [Clostridiales bacterium]|nr:proline--tRNA ligase [Clostridiales bacterium]
WKFSEQEMRGIPIRVEIGPKDIEKNQGVIVRRDTREKIFVSLDEIESKVAEVLETIQADMLKRAKEHRDSHTYIAKNMEEFESVINDKPGFIKAMWCMDEACENEIKDKTGATSRCMPFEQEHIDDNCVCCNKPAKVMAYWGKAY